jgi:hypothetical protein
VKHECDTFQDKEYHNHGLKICEKKNQNLCRLYNLNSTIRAVSSVVIAV